jgi:molecular chaperone Hsp33
MAQNDDGAVRAMTEDGAFRVITLRMTDTTQQIVDLQGASGSDAVAMSKILMGTVIVRETMAPSLRVQAAVGGSGGGRILGDSRPGGDTRGLLAPAPSQQRLSIDGVSLLNVNRVMPRGKIHQSTVVVPPSGDLSEAFMSYMQTSEQVTSAVGLGVQNEAGRIKAAGAYIVQLLPEITESPLNKLTKRLEGFPPIDQWVADIHADPRKMMDTILEGFDHVILEQSKLRCGCDCNAVGVLSAMSTLGKEEIQTLVDEGEALDIQCDYCRRNYQLGPTQLRTLLDES